MQSTIKGNPSMGDSIEFRRPWALSMCVHSLNFTRLLLALVKYILHGVGIGCGPWKSNEVNTGERWVCL